MANGQDITVHIEGLPPMHFPLGTSSDVIQKVVKARLSSSQPAKPLPGQKFIEEHSPRPGESGLEATLGAIGNIPKGIASLLDPTSGLSGALLTKLGINPRGGDVSERIGEIPLVRAAHEVKSAYKDPTTKPWEVPVAGLGSLVGVSAERQREHAQHGESGAIYGETAVPAALTLSSLVAPKVTKAATEAPGKVFRQAMYGGPKAVSEAIEKVASKNAPKIEEYNKSVQQAKEELAGKQKARAETIQSNEQLERTKQNLENDRRDTANRIVKNLDEAVQKERNELDARYKDYNQKVMGVSAENPNGTMTSHLAGVADAIDYAKKNILKGSATSISVFRDIMGRIKEVVEEPDGSLKPVEGKNDIPATQLQGYVRELQDSIYDHYGVPGDVREAIKHVTAAAKNEVATSIRDTHGNSAVEIYNKLSEDWSEYKRVWFDRSSVNALPVVRKFLQDINRVKSGLEVRESIAKLLRGEKGANIEKLLNSKTKWGANPNLIRRFLAIEEVLDKFDKPKKVPIEPEADLPKAPKLLEFNVEEFVRDARESRIKTINKYGVWAAGIWALHDVLNGRNPTTAIASIPSTLFLEHILRKPAIMKWLLKDMPTELERRTP